MILYHYTSIDGLLGILDKNVLWATQYRYLNDSTEFKFARIIIESLSGSKYSVLTEDTISKAVAYFDIMNRIYDLYSCSFSKEGDLLSQWRSYCPKEGGFSLGFNYASLKEKWGDELFWCRYENSPNQEEDKTFDGPSEGFCKRVAEILNQPGYKNPQSNMRSGSNLYDLDSLPSNIKKLLDKHDMLFNDNKLNELRRFTILSSLIKDSSFAEECESRYIELLLKEQIFEDIPVIKFRSKNGLLIPYKEIFFPANSITEIVVGPGINQSRNCNALQMYKVHKNLNFEIKKSKIPYQG